CVTLWFFQACWTGVHAQEELLTVKQFSTEASISLTFSSLIRPGDGTVTLAPFALSQRDANVLSDSFEPVKINVNDIAQVKIAGNLMTVTPTESFRQNGEMYIVTVSAGAVEDTDGTPFAGIFGTSYYFIAKDAVPPWVLKVEPESGTVGLGYQADGVDPILITFSEPVQVGTGPSGLQAKLVPSNPAHDIVPLAHCAHSDVTLVLHPTRALQPGAAYTVKVPGDLVRDLSGNFFAGLLNVSYGTADLQPQDATCTLGSQCAIRLEGAGFQITNRLRWTAGTCGECAELDAFESRGWRPYRPSAEDHAFYNFGIPKLPPGTYTMCWASLGSTRRSVNKAKVLIGSMRLLAARELEDERDEPVVARRLSQATRPEVFTMWQTGLRLLWSEVENQSSAGLAVGPSPLRQDRTCVAGLSCSIDLDGTFTDGDRVMVLGTCSEAGVLKNWPNSGRSYPAVDQNFSWGDVAVSAAGGVYRLCWCVAYTGPAEQHMPCDGGEDFRVDVGSMTLIGPGPTAAGQLTAEPDPLQQRTCVSGLSCVIHGITGMHLTDQDRYAVLDTCGYHATVARFGNGGFSSNVARSGATVYFGEVATSSSGGQYRLCWCSAVATCSSGEHFEVTAAHLLIAGPEPLEQDRTCVSGARCTVHVSGLLNSLDRVFVMDTCGQDHLGPEHQLVERFADSGLTMSVDASGALLSWSDSTSAGGQYRLCWCSADSACRVAAEFKTDIGALQVVGPYGRNDYTCISGQTCEIYGLVGQYLSVGDVYALQDTCGTGWVSRVPRGQSLSAEVHGATVGWGPETISAYTDYAGVPPHIPVASKRIFGWMPGRVFLNDNDQIAIRDTCGQSAAAVGFPNAGLLASGMLPRVSASGGQYRLCWCGLPSECARPENFRTDFGSLLLLGPSPLDQRRTCVSGQTCRLSDLLFHGEFDWSIGRLLILETCATHGVLPRLWAEPISPPPSSNSESLLGAFQTDVVSAAGGTYQMCWCSMIPGPCLDAENFHVSIGTLDIIGPSPLRQDRTCTSGQRCHLGGLLGEHMGTNDMLIADTCGSDKAAFVPRFINFGASDMVDDGLATWSIITAAGGQYRLCWCASTTACASASEFTTDMGGLLLLGPAPLRQDRTCVSGLSCEFEGFLGKYISSQDRILLSETCGDTHLPPSSLPPAQVTASQTGTAVVSWGTSPILAAGGFYRLCWCSGLVSQCEDHSEFRTDVGMLTIIGAHPLQQAKTCISGLPCTLEGITGTYVSVANYFAVLQTCGHDAGAIEGFPGAGVTAQVESIPCAGALGCLAWGQPDLSV
ncbi:unnamed protein product, partial [Symbiodinium sp. CCMP2456]